MIKATLIITTLLASTMAASAEGYVEDPSFSEYRSNEGSSDVWITHEDSKAGLGDVGSSSDSAFGTDLAAKFRYGEGGAARIRFKKEVAVNDFTATPGVSQIVTGLPKNTDMTFSLYYCDKKGATSLSSLYYGVREVVPGKPSLSGELIAGDVAHVSLLNRAPKGDKKCFRQVSVDFNSGDRGMVEIFSLMGVDTSGTDKVDMKNDLEVRVDDFEIAIK